MKKIHYLTACPRASKILGGCKLFPRLRRGFGGQVNSHPLVKKN